VAQAVVDGLEVVEVEVENRDRGAAAPGAQKRHSVEAARDPSELVVVLGQPDVEIVFRDLLCRVLEQPEPLDKRAMQRVPRGHRKNARRDQESQEHSLCRPLPLLESAHLGPALGVALRCQPSEACLRPMELEPEALRNLAPSSDCPATDRLRAPPGGLGPSERLPLGLLVERAAPVEVRVDRDSQLFEPSACTGVVALDR
jgi:hypothetical protein